VVHGQVWRMLVKVTTGSMWKEMFCFCKWLLQQLQPFWDECCWQMKHASHGLKPARTGRWKSSFLSRIMIPTAVCNKCLSRNNVQSPPSYNAVFYTYKQSNNITSPTVWKNLQVTVTYITCM
jgi:hypothetical protein